MIPLTLREIAGLVGGQRSDVPEDAEGAVVTGPIVVDSRQASAGSLFVALPGDNVDGHDYVDVAMAGGATGVLAARPVGVPAVIVEDPALALGKLARGVLERLSVPVVGVTGSSGKTSTKDLLAQVLTALGPTVAPPGSFNNEIGLPLTVLRADPTTRALVLEFGARGIGHIRTLTQIAPPRIGIVLNVGSAHVGEFGSREAVAKAKGELVEALPREEAGGVAVLNADDPRVRAMAERTSAKVMFFGEAEDADVRAEDLRVDDLGRASFTLAMTGDKAPVVLRLHGGHHVANALAAAAAARALGMSVPDVATALSEAVPLSRWRMEVSTRADGLLVVNDAYNANPESMRAALTALTTMARGRAGQTWAVLGEMRELGDTSEAEHEALGALAVELAVDRVIAVGAAGPPLLQGAAAADPRGEALVVDVVPDLGAAVALLRSEVRPDDVVLVKASRAIGLERVAEQLLADSSTDARATDFGPPSDEIVPPAAPTPRTVQLGAPPQDAMLDDGPAGEGRQDTAVHGDAPAPDPDARETVA